jgi:hypothetical protein
MGRFFVERSDMSSFNSTSSGKMRTTNKSGHAAYKLDDKTKLVTMALTTMVNEKKYYGDNTSEMIALAESLCMRGEGRFVAQLAVWARTKGNMRSVSHVLIAVAARWCPTKSDGTTKSFVRSAASRIASTRGDDGTEMLATYKALYGKPFPHALMRGIRDALSTASDYSLAKYQSRNKELKLRDTLRITHPSPLDKSTSDAMGGVVKGELPMPKTWETELSDRGNTKEVWDELITENRIGIFAAVRNLRNMIRAGADIDPILAKISDEEAVRKSRMLPFRFYSAWRELRNANLATTKVTRALDTAMRHACANVEGLKGRTVVMIDTSGSMVGWLSNHSVVTCRDVAAVLGAMVVQTSDDALIIGFDSRAYNIPMTGSSILADIDKVPGAGGWTCMASAFDALLNSGFDADRIVVLSDYEVNADLRRGNVLNRDKTMQSYLAEYRDKVGHPVWCHAIDLQGLGTQQFIGDRFNVMAGWSEQVLGFINKAEQGFDTLVSEIEGVEL